MLWNGMKMGFKSIRFPQYLWLLVLCFSYGFGGQDVRYRFELGRTSSYSVEMKSTTEGQGMGQDFSVSSRLNFDCEWTTSDISDSALTVIVLFRSFQGVLNFPMMGFYDSSFSFNEWTGKRIKLVFTPHGIVLEASALDEIPSTTMGTLLHIGPVEVAQWLILKLPPQAIDTNVSWKKTTPETMNQSGVNIMTKPEIEYKLAGKETQGRLACRKMVFGGNSTMEGAGSVQGMNVSVDGTVKTNGSALFAEANGLLVSVQQTQEMDITQTFSGAQSGAVITTSASAVTMKLKQ
jgi:hypothetical protein